MHRIVYHLPQYLQTYLMFLLPFKQPSKDTQKYWHAPLSIRHAKKPQVDWWAVWEFYKWVISLLTVLLGAQQTQSEYLRAAFQIEIELFACKTAMKCVTIDR